MAYEDVIRVNLSYLEARFMIHFLIEKHDELQNLKKTPEIKEQLSMVKGVHNKIMKVLEND